MARQKQQPNSISTFEQDFDRLAALVDKLEQGNVPLGEMLALYEEAATLSTRLKTTLDEAELKVEKLAAIHEESVMPSTVEPDLEANDLPDSEDLF